MSNIRLHQIEAAIQHLRDARDLMVATEHPHTAERIRLAISSAYGARRIEDARSVPREWGEPRKPPPRKVRNAVRARLPKALPKARKRA